MLEALTKDWAPLFQQQPFDPGIADEYIEGKLPIMDTHPSAVSPEDFQR